MNEADRHRVEEVQLLPPGPPGYHQAGLLEHAQVLHHPEAGHLQSGVQFSQRATVPPEVQVEQEPAGRMGECLEHEVVVGHARDIT
jgi:hypothetical protein